MMNRHILWSSIVALGMCAFTAAQPTSVGDAKHINDLIKQLDSTRFQERAATQKELEAIGWPALDQLRATVERSDLETKMRAAELVRQIEKNEIARDTLAPKRVRLNVKDMSVLDAFSLLEKESGYPIEVVDNWSKLAAKKITLDTGLVPFWQVYGTLWKISGLVERGPPPTGPVAWPYDGSPAAILLRRRAHIPSSRQVS